MRRESSMLHTGIRRCAGMPAAIVGALAMSLTAAPATAAAEPTAAERPTRLDALADRAAAKEVRATSLATTAAVPDSWVVVSGDTVWAIAQRFGLSPADVLAWNGLSSSAIIHPGQVLRLSAPAAASAPVAASGAYTVTSGDTLSGIAARHGVSLQAVFDANGLGYGSIIYPGQQITIPGALEATPVSAQTADAVLTTPAAAGLDAEQTANARLIIAIGRELGVSDRGIAIALATAMVESWIRNLDWGDRDSLGLFQQRPSTGWGTAAEILDAERSIRVFYGGDRDPNGARTRGLLDVAGWEAMGFSEAAQAVQRSAFPDRYGQWEASAYQWLAALG